MKNYIEDFRNNENPLDSKINIVENMIFSLVLLNNNSYSIFKIITVIFLYFKNKEKRNFLNYCNDLKIKNMSEKSVEEVKQKIRDFKNYIVTDVLSYLKLPTKKIKVDSNLNTFSSINIFDLNTIVSVNNIFREKKKIKKSYYSPFDNGGIIQALNDLEAARVEINHNLNRRINNNLNRPLDPEQYHETAFNEKPKKIEKNQQLNSINEVYNKFKNFIGDCLVGQIKGYIINNNKIIYNVEDLKNEIVINNIDYLIAIYYLDEDNNLKTTIKSTLNNTCNFKPLTNIEILHLILPIIYKIKINSSEISSELFGLKKEKNKLIKEENLNWVISKSSHKKLEGNNGYCISILKQENESNYKLLKFVFDDCEFKQISTNVKSYNLPKDKFINKGSFVGLKNNFINKYSISEADINNNKLVVISIKDNRSSKRINKNSNRRTLDVVTVVSKLTGNSYNIYAKHLKIN